MTTLSYPVRDSRIMLRRNIRHMQRYPSLTIMLIGLPVVFLLLFVFVFGNTLGDGLGGLEGGYTAYLQYVVPGIFMMALAGAAQGAAITVAMDMNEGIIARFRTMAISRASVLTGHVLGSMIQIVICLAAVIGIAFLLGFRAEADLAGWLGAVGMLAMISFAITWLAVALGLVAESVETASNTPMFLMLMPFLGSGFVPTESMPAGVRWFAENQPFTPFIEAVRGFLMGTPDVGSILVSTAWYVAIAAGGYLWARSAYDRKSVRA